MERDQNVTGPGAMTLRLDVPNQFAVDRYADHANVRDLYTKVLQIALRMGLDLEISRARLMGQDVVAESAREIRYAYHTEQVENNVYCLKASALPRYWFFDACGYSGWSEIAGDARLQREGESFDLDQARRL